MRVTKLQQLQSELKDLFYNNIHKFTPEQASKVLDLIMNGKKQNIISTIKKIKDNNDGNDIIINKKKNNDYVIIEG
jgi:uncharacterized protein YhfF